MGLNRLRIRNAILMGRSTRVGLNVQVGRHKAARTRSGSPLPFVPTRPGPPPFFSPQSFALGLPCFASVRLVRVDSVRKRFTTIKAGSREVDRPRMGAGKDGHHGGKSRSTVYLLLLTCLLLEFVLVAQASRQGGRHRPASSGQPAVASGTTRRSSSSGQSRGSDGGQASSVSDQPAGAFRTRSAGPPAPASSGPRNTGGQVRGGGQAIYAGGRPTAVSGRGPSSSGIQSGHGGGRGAHQSRVADGCSGAGWPSKTGNPSGARRCNAQSSGQTSGPKGYTGGSRPPN